MAEDMEEVTSPMRRWKAKVVSRCRLPQLCGFHNNSFLPSSTHISEVGPPCLGGGRRKEGKHIRISKGIKKNTFPGICFRTLAGSLLTNGSRSPSPSCVYPTMPQAPNPHLTSLNCQLFVCTPEYIPKASSSRLSGCPLTDQDLQARKKPQT